MRISDDVPSANGLETAPVAVAGVGERPVEMKRPRNVALSCRRDGTASPPQLRRFAVQKQKVPAITPNHDVHGTPSRRDACPSSA